jgi:Xaa-Pro aminopeptidase
MFTMHPTLLVGPADWDAARMPKAEFSERIAALWRLCDPSIGGAVIYGSPPHHAELAYFTHFTPKLEPAIALVPRTGEPRLLVGGGVNMLDAAKPLTWVERLLPLRDAGGTIAQWAAETGPLALINGDAMPLRLQKDIAKALPAAPLDLTSAVTGAMRRKSARETGLVRAACATLEAAVAAMRQAHHAGNSTTDVVLAGEQAAHRRGAQDVRTLFGSDGKLTPFTGLVAEHVEPLQAYVAVRHDGYWAEGFVVLARSVPSIGRRASEVLDKTIAAVLPGVPHRDLARLISSEIGPGARHPVVGSDFGHSIGLALEEPYRLNETSEAVLESGEVYTMRVGLADNGGSAVASAMMTVAGAGPDVLWKTA